MRSMRSLGSRIWEHRVTQLIVGQWFYIGLAVAVVLAYYFPNVGRHGGVISGEYTIGYGVVALIFLQNGLSISTKDLKVNIFNWRAHLVVQVLSFLVTSAITYGLCCWIKSSNDPRIDDWVLVGVLMTSTLPTTVASNVVMTTNAGGNHILALAEVVIGNVLGAFLSPLVAQMYMSTGPMKYGNPASGSSVKALYGQVLKQLSLVVFLPLIVGQVLRNVFPKQVKWTLETLRLRFLGSVCLLFITWSAFSTAFYQKAFETVSRICIIFLVFFNIGMYLFHTMTSFAVCRSPVIKRGFATRPGPDSSVLYTASYRIIQPFYFNRLDTVAVMFCAPAKTATLGVPLVAAQYGSDSPNLGKLLVPVVIYQFEQIVVAAWLVPLLRAWCRKAKPKPDLDQTYHDNISRPTTTTGQGIQTDMTHYLDEEPVKPSNYIH
ncbi:ABR085Cp [Eremothecium gossypii ATCC 10895]|uniref:ABR085Cp n=1 Tax=Eremothecium gossypii (strain ATCC 10895 / CBS 109.51 / FGSC 9923 / NRRL Y-1056) TaxID=284811 RepID=Q75DE2_EREGS|nr:ABR085Cp [Eremothecium gossypii ATCC 10895]AAS50855.2 ABR085Cp [Eremothecium gossypii ATCC 10895]